VPQVFFDGAVLSTAPNISRVVNGLPTNGSVIGARLWTYLGPSQWVYKEYRFNSAHALVSCSDEEDALVPNLAYANASCSACSWSVSLARLSCNTSAFAMAGTSSATVVELSTLAPAGDTYELAAWGSRADGQRFCCLFDDPNAALREVRLYGSSVGDTLAFHDAATGAELQPYGDHTIDARIVGYAGNDHIEGSATTSASYSETLEGGDGDDVIDGRGGDDKVYGGAGNDTLYGGAGDDLLITQGGADLVRAGTGNDVVVASGAGNARLYGEGGSDVLCGSQLGTFMQGSTTGSGGWNVLYWSSTAAGMWWDALVGINASSGGGSFEWCGNPSHAARMTWCDSPTLSTVPTACAQAGLAQ